MQLLLNAVTKLIIIWAIISSKAINILIFMPGLYYSRFLETFCVLFEHSIEAFESSRLWRPLFHVF